MRNDLKAKQRQYAAHYEEGNNPIMIMDVNSNI